MSESVEVRIGVFNSKSGVVCANVYQSVDASYYTIDFDHSNRNVLRVIELQSVEAVNEVLNHYIYRLG